VPIYEYECGLCETRFEEKQGFNDEPVTECPNCQGEVRRVIHSAPVIFKGSGFYITDSRKSNVLPESGGNGSKEDKPASKEKDKTKEKV